MAMASNGSFVACPTPFIAELSIGDTGGYLPGRWCTPHTIDNETVSCCFACPFTDWQYSDGFDARVVPWIALAVLILMAISALTYILLPVEDTQRHYLTSSPLMGFIFMSLAFTIPLGNSDHHCHDTITPNDWVSDTTCAFTGSLMHYGVWVLVIGCFFRSLSLYLQLIWDVEPGKRFRIVSLLSIFGGSLGLLGIALGVSGVSYQVGDMCYISYPGSIGSFWGPLIGVAFVSWLIQMFIMVYSVRGVLTRGGTMRFSIIKKRADYSDPFSRAAHAKIIRRNVRQILELQWRAIAICCLVLIYVVYVAQVVLRWGDPGQYSAEELKPWVDCLVREAGDKQACRDEARSIGPNQKSAVAALAMLASCGILGIICTARYTMILGWRDWFHDRFDDLVDLLPKRHDANRNCSTLALNHATGSDRRRFNGLDLELASTTDTQFDLITAVDSPTTLEEVDKLYGTRSYHVPKNSFSRPGTVLSVRPASNSNSNSIWNSLATPEHAYSPYHPSSRPLQTRALSPCTHTECTVDSASDICVGDRAGQNTITTTIESRNHATHLP